MLSTLGALPADTAEGARDWLFNVAAPLWSTRGRTASGLFAERMTLAGEPDDSYFRVFVQARHIFSFATAGRMGWDGPWQALIGETIEAVVKGARRADGFFVHRLDSNAAPLDTRADLYDQAFVLFALANAGAALGETRWFDVAEELLGTITQNWSHPAGGFTEGEIVDPSVRRQNPHMHLLEATMALADASGRERFSSMANDIADLAAAHFIDPTTGALLEYFTDTLEPAPSVEGRIVEPGHCFEWAWLFERLGAAGRADRLAISDGLTGFARSHGICPDRGVCINEVLLDGSIHNSTARLWPQTERIKAAAIRHRRTKDEAEAQETAAAIRGLALYYDVPTLGLWRDKLKEDGSFIEEFAPGSSLYHITCAYGELTFD
jgi:mannose/cellobiose epimerase-like protein (N-acyl-D-glucosamine 2-epimerase family)